MSLLKNVLKRITGNRLSQRLLDKNATLSLFLLGVGAGGDAASSGERIVPQLLRREYVPPFCVFDVGSNVGQYLKVLAGELSDYSYDIHCFEPGAQTFSELKRNAAVTDTIHLNNAALSREQGEMKLYYDKPGTGAASLTQRRFAKTNTMFEQFELVAVDTLDHYCTVHSIDHIHLLKIDVEGHELDVLEGAAGLFARSAIDLVTFEFSGCNIDTRTFLVDFYRFFKNSQMALFRITPSGFLHPIEPYRERYEQFRCTNFLAARKSV